MTWDELRPQLARSFAGPDLDLLDKAYAYAEKHHAGQMRLSGEPYITHTVETARILFQLHSDPHTLAAALLHDCLEDTSATVEDLNAEFGEKLTELVDGVTKISARVFRDSEERRAENLRKMVLAMARDIRVIVIKLADRLHNMRTLEFLPPEKRRRFSRETLEIYAPLAHRLGMGRIQDELEDLAFRHLHPHEYVDLVSRIEVFQDQRPTVLQEAQRQVEALLADSGLQGQVTGRLKHLYSIWTKMHDQKKELHQIYDLLALRILVPSIKDCYAALGLVHSRWKPMPGRFKDFIAMPKSNLYQSLHTTVIGPSGEPLEIQIRTQEMHRLAEDGIAAHWSYKEGKRVEEQYEQKLVWFKQLLEWQKDLHDSQDFMEALKIDLFKDEVLVFTPRGEVKTLPRGATPIDFAYLIHSGLGDTLIGARVNGRMVPLRTELKNGEIVEVLTRADARPSRDWLAIVKTAKAKNRIRHYFREQDREARETRGQNLLAEELERCGSSLAEAVRQDKLLDAARGMNFKSIEDLYAQIGDGNLSARSVAGRLGLTPPPAQPPPAPAATTRRAVSENGLHVAGISGVMMRFAKCCHPISGDPIIGLVSRGRGISIHRRDCPNIQSLMREPGRSLEVTWDDTAPAEHALELVVQAQERPGLLSDLVQVFQEAGISLKSTSTRTNSQNQVTGLFTLQVKGQSHLQDIIRKLEQVKGVFKVSRKGFS